MDPLGDAAGCGACCLAITRLLHRAARKARACCECVFLLPDFGLGLDTAGAD